MLTPVVLSSLLAGYVAAETFSLSVEKLVIKDPSLPQEFHNLKVVFITDIHHGRYSSVARLKRMVRQINDLQPDLILMGGDFLQTVYRRKSQMKQSFDELLRILMLLNSPPYGIYTVLGNHDYVFSESYNRRKFAEVGIEVLINEGVFFHQGRAKIRLSGVGDVWFGQPDLAQAQGSTTPDTFTLLLNHQPNFIDTITPADGINFVFSGHTHGGQLRMFNYLPFMPRSISRWEYTVGLIETPQTRMLVSPGVGNVAPFFRFFAPPKIHLLTFKSAPRVSTLSQKVAKK